MKNGNGVPVCAFRANIGLALVYMALGGVAHLVAPSNGFVSLVWLPAGLALGVMIVGGGRMWSGVLIGAFVLDAYQSYAMSGDVVSSLLNGCVIACGSCLQAIVGARIVRRFAGEQPLLDSPSSVWPFLLLGALGASTISASIGTVWLQLGGATLTAVHFETWLLWWAGDALGVVLVTPIILSLFGEPAAIWRDRRLSLLLPLLSAIVVVSMAFAAISRYEGDRQRAEFERLAARNAASLQSALKLLVGAPATVTDYYRVHGPFGRGEFESFAARQHARHPGILAFLWIPQEGQGTPVRARWVFPSAIAQAVEGLDFHRIPALATALERATEESRIVASGKVALPQLEAQGDLVMLIAPVVWAPPGTADDRLRGYVGSLVGLGELVRQTLPGLREDGLVLQIDDLGNGGVVYRSEGEATRGGARYEVSADFGGQAWRLAFARDAASVARQQAPLAWAVYLGGLFFCTFLSSFLLVITGYSARAERQVRERTSDLEAARNEAERASKLLHEAVGSIAQGFTIYDEQDRLVVCNEAYLKIYEDSRDLIVPGRTFEEIVRRGAERGQYQAAAGRVDEWVAERVRQHQQANGQVLEQQLGDGRWLMIVEYRTPSGYIAGNRIDITPLKKAAALIEDRNAQLDALFSLSPDGFVAFDRSGAVKFANPAFYEMTGVTEPEILGRDERAFVAALKARAEPGENFMWARTTHPDEERKVHNLNLAAPNQRNLQVVGVLSDATSVERILYFRDATREFEISRMKSEFLSHAAHELRTPMTSILGFAELMLLKKFDEGRQREILQTIHRQTKWLVDIINELLDLARIEARRGKDFNVEDVDLVPLLKDAVAGLSFDRDRWPVDLSIVDGQAIVRGDVAKLRQAMVNIISNAQKYSPSGGQIAVRMRERPGYFGVEVSDHGLGMTPEQLKNFGERFWRADTSGKTPGTGLGVSIVKEIVALHGGELDVRSEHGQGTRITVWLPVIES